MKDQIYLYLGIKTVPDDSRQHLWNLPETLEGTPAQDPMYLVTSSAEEVATILKDHALALTPEFLNAVWQAELNSKKPRATVLKAVEAARQAPAALVKELSLDPERCRVVAMGMAIEEHEPSISWVGEEMPYIILQEKTLLTWVWDMAIYYPNMTIVGYNILGFDLPVLCARSIMLGVNPSIQIDWRKYGNERVIDLMLARFPYGKYKPMKELALQYGIEIPAPDLDGSMVHTMTPDQLAEYLRSDIIVTRELHRKFAGYFCPPIHAHAEKEENLF